jgi:hypothetical protein
MENFGRSSGIAEQVGGASGVAVFLLVRFRSSYQRLSAARIVIVVIEKYPCY